jgi:hypothetical protein
MMTEICIDLLLISNLSYAEENATLRLAKLANVPQFKWF